MAERVATTGAVVSTDTYDAFGQRLSGGSYGDAYGYGGQAGYRTDAETGLCLLTHRYYDPAQGRFVTRDPLGQAGGINLYSYTQNNPGNWDDPSGLLPPNEIPSPLHMLHSGPETEEEQEIFDNPSLQITTLGGGVTFSPGDQTSEDLYAFGSKKDGSQPIAPRVGTDIEVDNGTVVAPEMDPENNKFGVGVSLTNQPKKVPLSGNYYRIPAGTQLPEGISIIRDGKDIYPASTHGKGHYSAFPTNSLSLNDFTDLYRSLFENIPSGCNPKR